MIHTLVKFVSFFAEEEKLLVTGGKNWSWKKLREGMTETGRIHGHGCIKGISGRKGGEEQRREAAGCLIIGVK